MEKSTWRTKVGLAEMLLKVIPPPPIVVLTTLRAVPVVELMTLFDPV